MDIFERELAGEVIDPQTDPEFDKFLAVQRRSYELTHKRSLSLIWLVRAVGMPLFGIPAICWLLVMLRMLI